MSDSVQLFAAQKQLYPRTITGRYRRLKWLVMAVLLGIYWLAPWLRWDRGPNAPDQAILIDMPARRAYWFWIEIWPQEVYYLTGILILAAVCLFFVTSLLGRVWCGYACFQTVWTDLFIQVERWVQGDRNARMKLDQQGWSFEWLWKKALTHAIWLIIGLLTGGAWVLYFNDAPTLMRDMLQGHVSTAVGGWILGLTFSTYLMAGFAREQVCTYMCPYSRFQSAMFDKDTLIITYDAERGEPRGSHKQGETWEGRGHCIDCNQCVVVCPMGIDIRKGLQLECIACGLCVDACNNVMDKVGLPRGLIRYDTEHNQQARQKAHAAGQEFKDRLRFLRPRSFWYIFILSLVGGIMLYGLLSRSTLDLHVLHDRNPLLVRLSDGRVRNGYTIKILDKSHEDGIYTLTVEGLPEIALKVEGPGSPEAGHLHVAADSVGDYRVLVTTPESSEGPSRRTVTFTVKDTKTGKEVKTESMFVMR